MERRFAASSIQHMACGLRSAEVSLSLAQLFLIDANCLS